MIMRLIEVERPYEIIYVIETMFLIAGNDD